MKSDDCQTCYCSRGKVLCKGEPCTSVTVSSVTVPLEEPQKCVNGWTAWINQNPAIKGKKFKDVEPLPSLELVILYYIIYSSLFYSVNFVLLLYFLDKRKGVCYM